MLTIVVVILVVVSLLWIFGFIALAVSIVERRDSVSDDATIFLVLTVLTILCFFMWFAGKSLGAG